MRSSGGAKHRTWRFQNLIVPLAPLDMSKRPITVDKPFNEVAYLTTRAFQDKDALPTLKEAITDFIASPRESDYCDESEFRKKLHQTAKEVLDPHVVNDIFLPSGSDDRRRSAKRTLRGAGKILSSFSRQSTTDTDGLASAIQSARGSSKEGSKSSSKETPTAAA